MSRRSGWATAGPLFLLIGAILGVSGLAASRAEPVERFELVDVAQEVGLDATHSAFRWGVTMDPVAMMGGGACWIDVDADGWLDLFLTDSWANGEWGRWNDAGGVPTTRVFRNNAGSFEEYTEQWSAGFEARAGGCVAADFDNDGFTDLYVTTERENLLLWNRGTGFVEGATAADVDSYGWQTGAAAGDLNGDGLVDLVVAGYADLNKPRPEASTGFPNPFEPVGDLVFINQGGRAGARPTFMSVGAEVGIEPDGPEYGLGVVLVDFDNDGDLDIHIANDTQPNRLYLNEPTPDGSSIRFVDASAKSGADDPNSGMGIGTAELNGDGFPDLLVTNLAGQGHASLTSSVTAAQAPRFEAVTDDVFALGMSQTGWGASFGDLDLDGDLDLLVASGAIPITDIVESGEALTYFSNETSGTLPTLVERSALVGLDDLAPRNGRSVALADYDNDGDLDALVTSIGQRIVLLENRAGTRNKWLTIDFGAPSPGTRVEVDLEDGTVLVRWAAAGGSWLSSEDPRLNFGLGPDPGVVDVTILPPSGGTLRFEDVDLNRILVVTP